MKVKLIRQCLKDSNGKIHLQNWQGEPICGMSSSDEDENGKPMIIEKTVNITCKDCIEFIKWVKNI